MFFIFATTVGASSRYNVTALWAQVQPHSNITFSHFEKIASSFSSQFDWTGYDKVMSLPIPDEVIVYQRKSMCEPNQSGPRHVRITTLHAKPRSVHTETAEVHREPSPQSVVINDLVSGKTTSASVSSSIVGIMALMAFQTVSAIVTQILPMNIPPPIWNNLPLPCVPMVTGSNCFGAIIYPITLSDSIMANIVDDSLDAVIEGFPGLFEERTRGRPYSFRQYQECFKAYMSMHCAAVFPACTALQGTQDYSPGAGRMPICFHVCLMVLIQCPGFHFDDIRGPCLFLSPIPPPFCAFALYTREDGTPPPLDDDDDVIVLGTTSSEDDEDESTTRTLTLNSTNNVCPPLDMDQDLEIDPTIDSDELIEAPTLDFSRLPILRSVE